jgi:hypothetical protein
MVTGGRWREDEGVTAKVGRATGGGTEVSAGGEGQLRGWREDDGKGEG